MRVELWPEGAPYAAGSDREDRPALTAYLVEGEKTAAAMIICPGGSYAKRAPHESEPVAEWLNTLGISAFVLDYRVAPYKHPAPLADAQRAIRLVRSRTAEWGIDPERVGILGFSAGGHLAAAAGTLYDNGRPDAQDSVDRESSRPDLLVLCYPVISFGEYGHRGSVENLLGPNPADKDITLLSAEKQVTSDTPPAFLWHTSDDPAVPVENSLLFASALNRHSISFELHSYMSGRHGLGLAETHPEARTWPNLCGLWLKRMGFAPK